MKRREVVFLVDVDNTLLDNDRVVADMRRRLEHDIGAEAERRYWEIFEQLRTEMGYADYLGALQRYRLERPRDVGVFRASLFLTNYPFANRLYPQSLDAIEHLGQWGEVVILSDGDVVFQPRKVERSGLMDAVDGRVLIYVHKEEELDDVEQRYPASHYVVIDDKVRLLAAIKRHWGTRVTTIFPRQGHYAHDLADLAKYPEPDIAVERIGALLELDFHTLRSASRSAEPARP